MTAALDRRHERIVEAAGFCFSEKSVKRTTMDEIAEAAGVSKPILYKHFESKDVLADAVISEALESWQRIADEAAGADAPILDRITSRMRATASFVTERPVLRTILRQDRTLRAQHGRHFLRARENSLAQTASLLREGIRTGELAAGLDVDATARVIEVLTHGLVQSLYGLHVIGASEGMIDAATELVGAGLRSR